jgi:hypothetical protein
MKPTTKIAVMCGLGAIVGTTFVGVRAHAAGGPKGEET